MLTFFHGWRRKAGCVTLMVACAVMGMWVRSCVISDAVILTIGNQAHLLLGTRHRFFWIAFPTSTPDLTWAHGIDKGPADERAVEIDENRRFYRTYNGHREWIVDYWLIANPLTLLAACLILWPRKWDPRSTQR